MVKYYKYFLLTLISGLILSSCGNLERPDIYNVIFTANTERNIKNFSCRVKKGNIAVRSYLIKKAWVKLFALGSDGKFFYILNLKKGSGKLTVHVGLREVRIDLPKDKERVKQKGEMK